MTARVIRWPALSPDGNRSSRSARSTAFGFKSSRTERRHGLTDLDVGEFMPSWSPDGRPRRVRHVVRRRRPHLPRHRSVAQVPPNSYRATPRSTPIPCTHPTEARIVFITGNREDQLYSMLTTSTKRRSEACAPRGTTDLRYRSCIGRPVHAHRRDPRRDGSLISRTIPTACT